MTDEIEVIQFGQTLGEGIHTAMVEFQHNAPRTVQSAQRVLGMSDLGGCREFIRATVAGEPRDPARNLKWPAAVGTAVGDWVENAILALFPDAVTQETVTLIYEVADTLTMSVTGHLDARIGREAIVDLKTKDGLAEVRREGASWENLVQASGYLIAALQMGLVDEGASAHLVYLDRSGSEPVPHVVSISMARARLILQANAERLQEVATAMATGRSAPRDKPESWCFNVGCPFYSLCWSGYLPSEEITHPEELKAVREFIDARAAAKEAGDIRLAKREALKGVQGVAHLDDGDYVVRWTITAGQHSESEKLEVMKLKAPKTKEVSA